MPRSKYILFVSQYPLDRNWSVDENNHVTARIKAFNYIPRRFLVIEVEEIKEGGEVAYIYYGIPIGER